MSYQGILGMNARNLKYIRPYNFKKQVRLVDSKIATKNILKKHGIPTPRFFGVIRSIREFEKFDFDKLPCNFVIKPNRGFGGGGILVLKNKDKRKALLNKPIKDREWVDGSMTLYTFNDMKAHILDILDGKYSLSNLPDTALIERKVVSEKKLLSLCKKGVPDIRVIVFNKVPVMVMTRIPTKRSKGKANLSAGAIGVGVDLSSGKTTSAIVKSPKKRMIEVHPDTGKQLLGIEIPYFEKILEMAVEAQMATKLGFLGVDVIIDRKYGPEILELNARPGLEIQSANLEGLAARLERVKGLKINTISKGIRVGAELFGGDIERRVENVSGKEVIGLVEKVTMLTKSGERKVEVTAKIDTGADSTSIDVSLAKKLGFKEVVDVMKKIHIDDDTMSEKKMLRLKNKVKKELKKKTPDIEEFHFVRSSHGLTLRPYVKLVYYLASRKTQSLVNITDRTDLTYKMIIGRKDLGDYLIDPDKSISIFEK